MTWDDMIGKLEQFRRLADQLREVRRTAKSCYVDERSLLGNLADILDEMDDNDQLRANADGWRGWPDLYDERMMQAVEEIDPDDAGCAGSPPRRYLETAEGCPVCGGACAGDELTGWKCMSSEVAP